MPPFLSEKCSALGSVLHGHPAEEGRKISLNVRALFQIKAR